MITLLDESRVYFKSRDGNIVIINDDFLATNAIPRGSVDLIVTSPPYNVDIHYESFDDSIPYEKYLEFTEKWLRKALELAKPDGRMCLNIPLDKSRGRSEEGFHSVYADVVAIARIVGKHPQIMIKIASEGPVRTISGILKPIIKGKARGKLVYCNHRVKVQYIALSLSKLYRVLLYAKRCVDKLLRG